MRSGSGRHPKTNGRARQRPVWVRRVGRGPTTTLLATKRRQWQWGRRGNVTRAGRARRMRRWGGGGGPRREGEGACPLQYLAAVVSRAVPGPGQGGRGGWGRGQADLGPPSHPAADATLASCLSLRRAGREGQAAAARGPQSKGCSLARGGRWARGHSSMGETALAGDAGVGHRRGLANAACVWQNFFPPPPPFPGGGGGGEAGRGASSNRPETVRWGGGGAPLGRSGTCRAPASRAAGGVAKRENGFHASPLE